MIAFPDIDPIAIRLGPVAVHWYGIAYVAGFFAGLHYLKYLCRKYYPNGPVTPQHAEDIFIWIILGIVLGGRLGYVLFYNPSFFFEHPEAIIKTWQGGMSFHGGLIGVLTAILIFTRKHGMHFFDFSDRVAPGICFGLCFGRLANFINGELFGRVTDVPWGMVFPHGGPLPRHPSQLYEAFLEGVILFTVLHLIAIKRQRRFEVSGYFMLGYGLCRFVVEYFRQPDNIPHLQHGIFTVITMGQILCLPMMAIGLALIYLSRRKGTPVEHPAAA
ncbi:MAG: prolipoprotein diacylglyceryl transferase [Proteobacteria bacterium]|nr:prolipoprotein diacylglyceryl transferase [Pseudomonadota bacterium]